MQARWRKSGIFCDPGSIRSSSTLRSHAGCKNDLDVSARTRPLICGLQSQLSVLHRPPEHHPRGSTSASPSLFTTSPASISTLPLHAADLHSLFKMALLIAPQSSSWPGRSSWCVAQQHIRNESRSVAGIRSIMCCGGFSSRVATALACDSSLPSALGLASAVSSAELLDWSEPATDERNVESEPASPLVKRVAHRYRWHFSSTWAASASVS